MYELLQPINLFMLCVGVSVCQKQLPVIVVYPDSSSTKSEVF